MLKDADDGSGGRPKAFDLTLVFLEQRHYAPPRHWQPGPQFL
jgi:hypothetical protein